jgi:hypothetical protein
VNYSNLYNIDFRRLATLLTPTFLRKVKFIDWLETLLKPLEEVNFSFKQFRKDSIYKVTHNGQVVYLQKVLNDSFDNEFRRIKIKDSFENDPTWIYPQANENPTYIYDQNSPTFLYDNSIFNNIEVDFVLSIPSGLKPFNEYDQRILEIQIKSIVNYYKLASKRFKILWI